MAERTSSGSLSLDRIARTPLRNKREIDRGSLTSVSRTIAASESTGNANALAVARDLDARVEILLRRQPDRFAA